MLPHPSNKSQAAGEAMAMLVPRWGKVGQFLNPGPFNMKEHAAIVIMASSASVSATSTLVIAAQKLYYGGYPNAGGAVFITMATQRMFLALSFFPHSVPKYSTDC